MKIEWLQDFNKERTDSIWYGGDIVKITINKRYVAYISACGDIRAKIKGEYYCDKNNGGCFVEYLKENNIFNDKDLAKAISNNEFEFLNNNWFEINIYDNKKKCYLDMNFDNVIDLEKGDNFKWVKEMIKGK